MMENRYTGLLVLLIGIVVMLFGYTLDKVFYYVGSFIIGVGLAKIK